jgi:hypothetical protein
MALILNPCNPSLTLRLAAYITLSTVFKSVSNKRIVAPNVVKAQGLED